jgi:hypothetical protein
MMGSPVFCLDIMADLTRDQTELVRKYKLHNQVAYSTPAAKEHLDAVGAGNLRAYGSFLVDRLVKRTLLVKDLVDGQHIECKDLGELIATEEQVREAFSNLTRYLIVAAKFDGSEEIVTVAA